MTFTAYSPRFIWQASRSGYPEKNVSLDAVEEWLAQVRERGIRTIICLLDDTQLGYYRQLGSEGLFGAYRQAGFAVIHRPVADHQHPYVSNETLELVFSDVLNAATPILVHCSAGMERSPAVCEYLVQQSVEGFRDRVTECMEQYSRERGNAHPVQVARLSMQLFDKLQERHRLSTRYRTALWAAAMLHDIGTDRRHGVPPTPHGWFSAYFILALRDRFACSLARPEEIAAIAALHSVVDGGDDSVLGSVPEWLRETFRELPQDLRWLVAILRVADGLDRGLDQTVAEVSGLDLPNQRIVIRGKSLNLGVAISGAYRKAALLKRLLGCPGLRICDVEEVSTVPKISSDCKPKAKPVACFDITGTLVDHQDGTPVPLMPELLLAFCQSGWKLYVTTTWMPDAARRLLDPILRAGKLPSESVSTLCGKDKAACVTSILAGGAESVVFVDDKPQHIEAMHVQHGQDARVRVLGFLGSGKYVHQAGKCCKRLGVPYVLSAVDLAERLGVQLPVEFADLTHLTDRNLIDLIPGLEHPCSSIAGDTGIFSHRMIAAKLLATADDLSWELRRRMWEKLGWIRCDECIWKWMVQLALVDCGKESQELPGKPYKAHEYLTALQELDSGPRLQIREALQSGLSLMHRGWKRVGAEGAIASDRRDSSAKDWVEENLRKCEQRVAAV